MTITTTTNRGAHTYGGPEPYQSESYGLLPLLPAPEALARADGRAGGGKLPGVELCRRVTGDEASRDEAADYQCLLNGSRQNRPNRAGSGPARPRVCRPTQHRKYQRSAPPSWGTFVNCESLEHLLC